MNATEAHNPATFITPSGMTLNEAADRLEADANALEIEALQQDGWAAYPNSSAVHTREEVIARHTEAASVNRKAVADWRATVAALRAGIYPVPASS